MKIFNQIKDDEAAKKKKKCLKNQFDRFNDFFEKQWLADERRNKVKDRRKREDGLN